MVAELDARSTRLRIRWVSALIAAFFVIQGFNTISLFKRFKHLNLDRETHAALKSFFAPPYWYPFVDYPMYSQPRAAGDAINRYEVFATVDDGSEVSINEHDFDTSFWVFKQSFVNPFKHGDLDSVREFVSIYEQRNDVVLTSLRLVNDAVTVGADGVHDAPREIVTSTVLRTASSPHIPESP